MLRDGVCLVCRHERSGDRGRPTGRVGKTVCSCRLLVGGEARLGEDAAVANQGGEAVSSRDQKVKGGREGSSVVWAFN